MTVRRRAAAGLLAAAAVGVAADAPAAPDGEQLYTRCTACHALAYDRVGPPHCGLFGRRAGSVPGFAYTPAMRGSGIVWNAATLDRFLTAPTKVVPGTSMTYDGISDAAERAALIAWLARAGRSAECARSK